MSVIIVPHIAGTEEDGLVVIGVPAGSVDLGTFTGTTIPDDSTVKEALQALETALEADAGASITALHGDGTATGPGDALFTIAAGAVTDAKSSLSNKPPVTCVATTNQALSGTPTIDGQTTTANQSIVLLTAQSTPSQNGPWVVQSGAWTRPTWFPSGGTTQAVPFSIYFVRLGTTYAGTTWRQTTNSAVIIDTTSLAFSIVLRVINSSTISANSLLPIANGGTGIGTTPTDGQLLIGSSISSSFALATLTAGSGMVVTNGANSITVAQSNALVVKTANYTITAADRIIACDSTSAAFNLTLPAPSTVTGIEFKIIDQKGTFDTNNVTLVRNGSEQISGLTASRILSAKWGRYVITSDGTNWLLG